jgi:uncharacterized protein (TIGR03437 family)
MRPLIPIYLLAASVLPAQVCRLSVAGLNQSRSVTGAIHAECPGIGVVHTAPFGNWGVSSNYGQKHDSHQFDGWCHDMRVCDNTGVCRTDCTDGWYEWNSCTDESAYTAPNCTLYNAQDCTAQATSTGINVHGTKLVDIGVRCPQDTNGDGFPDQGGCADLRTYTSDTNFMSLYELDPVCCDDLVQTVYFPTTSVSLSCDAWGCGPAASGWVKPSFYNDPASPAKISAELATAVNWGAFVDNGACGSLSNTTVATVSGASYVGPAVAPGSFATIFGQGLSPITDLAGSTVYPTSLGSVSVQITDTTGRAALAPLSYVSAKQVNLVVPAELAAGPATVTVMRSEIARATGNLQIDPVAPAIFTADGSGRGVAAALAISVDGSHQTTSPVFSCEAACTAVPVHVTGNTHLVLFATGIRNNTDITKVGVSIGTAHAKVEYAGPQNQYPGLDQINVLVPPDTGIHGEVDVLVSVAGKAANPVRIALE